MERFRWSRKRQGLTPSQPSQLVRTRGRADDLGEWSARGQTPPARGRGLTIEANGGDRRKGVGDGTIQWSRKRQGLTPVPSWV